MDLAISREISQPLVLIFLRLGKAQHAFVRIHIRAQTPHEPLGTICFSRLFTPVQLSYPHPPRVCKQGQAGFGLPATQRLLGIDPGRLLFGNSYKYPSHCAPIAVFPLKAHNFGGAHSVPQTRNLEHPFWHSK